MGCMRGRGRLHAQAGRQRLGSWQATRHQRIVGRYSPVRRLARQEDRQTLPTSDGGRMGIRRARHHRGGRAAASILDGPYHQSQSGQLRRQFRLRRRCQDGHLPPEDPRGRLLQAQRLRSLRHARQRVGVGRGLLQGQLRRRAHRRLARKGIKLQSPHPARRRVELLPAAPSFCLSLCQCAQRTYGECWLTRSPVDAIAVPSEMNRMSFRIVLRPDSARLAMAAIALVTGATYSQPLRAQFGGSPYGSYGNPYGSNRGPYKQYRQYDPYDDDRGPSPSEDRGDMVPFKRSGVPLLTVVGLDTQRVSIYDSAGRLMQRSPVSTGQTGYETPAGIFSVVQKKADHNSNLYEDGNMPFMQRITWTGIAMHGGVLPGHPASHGCVRLPIDFARRLFDLTDVGMRVIIVPHDITLAEFDHPYLLRSNAARVEPPAQSVKKSSRGTTDALQTLRSIASSKDTEAAAAQRRASEARRAATRTFDAAAAAAKALRAAEGIHERADAQLKDAEKALDAARTGGKPEAIKRAETAKDKAAARLAEADKQLQTAKAHAQAKTDAVKASEDEAKAAEAASDAAHEAATETKRKTLPISVFVSRKTQRFYVRQGYVPVFEGPISIQDHEKPLGTYVFTAFGDANERVRWGVISMYADGKVAPEPVAARSTTPKEETRDTTPADVAGAKAALDRIAIPQEAIQRITDVVLPGSSLIVSDEGPSIETGKDTDFVIVMSGEPQGALKVRQRQPPVSNNWGGPYGGWGNSPN